MNPLNEGKRFLSRVLPRPLGTAVGRCMVAGVAVFTLGTLVNTAYAQENSSQTVPVPEVPYGSKVTWVNEDLNPLTQIIDPYRLDLPFLGQKRLYNPYDTFPDPIFRAASVRIEGTTWDATGAIVEDKGVLKLVTAGHVGRSILRDQGIGLARYLIADVGQGFLLPEDLSFAMAGSNTSINDDHVAVYPFGDRNSKILREAMRKKILTPLNLFDGEVKPGDQVVMQKHLNGAWVRYGVVGPNPIDAGILLKRESDKPLVNCTADSGSPALREVNGKVTNQAIGVLVSGRIDTSFPDPDPSLSYRTCFLTEEVRTLSASTML